MIEKLHGMAWEQNILKAFQPLKLDDFKYSVNIVNTLNDLITPDKSLQSNWLACFVIYSFSCYNKKKSPLMLKGTNNFKPLTTLVIK